MPFLIGENVGAYRLVAQLGKGGMATVYKAYHAALDRFVAIKVLHMAFTQDPNFLARFQREARLVARLEHPSIVPIYDFAEHEGRPFLVMKFIEGETLKARLERGRLAMPEVQRIVERIGAALAYAHTQGVLHRDIKPSNVLIAVDGALYLSDFGLARMAEAGESSLTADRMVGTPQYMSPEQALSRADLDARTDIYSFGVMLYEMLTGRVPFNADTPFAIIHDHIYSPLPLPRQVSPDLPEAVESVVLKCLAKEPADRYPDAMALVNAFRAAAQTAVQPPAAPTMITPQPVETAQVENRPEGTPLPAARMEAAPPAATLSAPLPAPRAAARAGHKSVLPWVIGGAVVLIGLACLLIGGFWLVNQQLAGQPLAQVQTATVVQAVSSTRRPRPTRAPGDQPPPPAPAGTNANAVQQELDSIEKQYDDGGEDQAIQRLQKVYDLSAGDANVLNSAVQRLVYDDYNLLAAELLFGKDRPATQVVIDKTQGERLHEILFWAAEEPQAGRLMQDNQNNPLFSVAEIRYKLFNGTLDAAQKDYNQFIQNPVNLQRFPETYLLEVEIAEEHQDWGSAQKLCNHLLSNPSILPEWVYNAAVDFNNELKTQTP
jgi:predicted Ser/Thr protein kinase